MLAALKTMPRSHLLWGGASVACALLAIIFYVIFTSSGGTERLRAAQDGQRLLVNLATGEIEGEMQQLFPDALPEEAPIADEGATDADKAEKRPDEQVQDADPEQAADPYAEFTAGLEEQMEETPPREDMNPAPSLAKQSAPEKNIPVFPRTVASLEAPNQVFMQNSEHGLLPDRGPNDTVAWKFYSRRSELPNDVIKLAVAITDLGAHHGYGSEAMTLPLDVSLMFTAYGPDALTWVESARNRGQEAWMQMPIEMQNYPANDPGPLGLLTTLSQEETLQRLHKNLARLQAYTGIYFPPEDNFTRQGALMQVVLNDVRARGLLALIGNRDTASDWAQRYRSIILPQTTHIAPPYNAELLKRNLESVERKAIKDGRLILTVEPTPLALSTLKEWLPTLTAKGIALVPLSAMMDQ